MNIGSTLTKSIAVLCRSGQLLRDNVVLDGDLMHGDSGFNEWGQGWEPHILCYVLVFGFYGLFRLVSLFSCLAKIAVMFSTVRFRAGMPLLSLGDF